MTDTCSLCPFVGCTGCPIKQPPKARQRAGLTRAQEVTHGAE